MPKNFSLDFYESILKASDKGKLWGIKEVFTPLEYQLLFTRDFS
tara:strand:+ start:462 stop:593 length:132 start_codon:yes stop_codon:yes gene_type:complete